MKAALAILFGERVAVHYSTSKELNEGIKPGEDWFNWIGEQVREAKIAFILLTPASIHKPWVLWEAGAVSGVALAIEGTDHRKLRPLSFKLQDSNIPTPFAREQITDGLDGVGMQRLFEDLLDFLAEDLGAALLIKGAQNLQLARQEYLEKAREAMRLAPMVVTEAAVQEWIERIDHLVTDNRQSEVGELHDWLNVAFGRDTAVDDRPLDIRIHRRLGELYARSGMRDRAAKEFELSRDLSPRDVFVLRRLGKAYLDLGRAEEAGRIIAEIEELDSEAFVRNAENAALKARWCRESKRPEKALQVLKDAWDKQQTSYYLGDLLGQAQLSAGDLKAAKQTYRTVLSLVQGSIEDNIFVSASGLTAAIVVGDAQKQAQFVTRIRLHKPSPEEMTSIARGLARLQEAGMLDTDLKREIDDALSADSQD